LIAALAGTTITTAIGRTIVSNLLKMIPGPGIVGSAIQSTTAATLTLSLGLAYIELMKAIARAKIQGIQLSPEEMKDIFIREYQSYVASGSKTLKDDFSS